MGCRFQRLLTHYASTSGLRNPLFEGVRGRAPGGSGIRSSGFVCACGEAWKQLCRVDAWRNTNFTQTLPATTCESVEISRKIKQSYCFLRFVGAARPNRRALRAARSAATIGAKLGAAGDAPTAHMSSALPVARRSMRASSRTCRSWTCY